MVEIARCNVVASHALAIRRSALDLVLPFGSDWQADWWVALVLSAVTGIAVVENCLVEYRLHDLNTVGLREKIPLAERVSHERWAASSAAADLLAVAVARVSHLRPGVLSPGDRVRSSRPRSLICVTAAHCR